MDNATLSSRADQLEKDLKSTINGLMSVGWMKDPDVGPVLMVYLNRLVNCSGEKVPTSYHGIPVVTQFSQPMGTKPPQPVW